MGSFPELAFIGDVDPAEPSPSRTSGAALLALLTQELGPLPLALAEAKQSPRPGRRRGRGGLPLEVSETLLVRKGVVELSSLRGAGAMSLALRLMAEAVLEAPGRWLCALDPQRSLFAPAVASRGVPLERTLVLRPPLEELGRLSVRVARSGVFTAVLVDATSLSDLSRLPVGVRRLTLAAEDQQATVFLLTSAKARRPQPLPVAARALVEPGEGGATLARVLRHRHGRLGTLVVPAPDDELPARYSELPTPLPAPRAGKDQRVPAATQARGARGRRLQEARQQTLLPASSSSERKTA